MLAAGGRGGVSGRRRQSRERRRDGKEQKGGGEGRKDGCSKGKKGRKRSQEGRMGERRGRREYIRQFGKQRRERLSHKLVTLLQRRLGRAARKADGTGPVQSPC